MTIVGDTGNGATFTLTTQTAIANYKISKISIGELTYDMLDVSTLSTSGHEERIIADLEKGGDVTLDFFHSTYATAVTVTRAVDTATVTFPAGPSQTTTTGATYTGTGYVTKVKLPDLENNVPQAGQIVFSFNGDTGPTYTRGS